MSSSLNLPFSGSVFCISGSFTLSQSEMKSLLKTQGAKVVDTVSKECTAVIANEVGSAKTKKAEQMGLPVHTEEWVHTKLGMKPAEVSISTTTKRKRKPQDEEEEEKRDEAPQCEEEEIPQRPTKSARSSAPSASKVFSGLVFCVSGDFLIPQSKMKSLLECHGGKVAPSVNSSVTHVVANEIGSAKTMRAQENDLPIVAEEWVNESIRKGELSTKHFTTESNEDGEEDQTGNDEEGEEEQGNTEGDIDVSHILNTSPLGAGCRKYEILFSQRYEDPCIVYAVEHHGNEKALAHLRNVMAVEGDDESIGAFLNKYGDTLDEEEVKTVALSQAKKFRKEILGYSDTGGITFTLLNGKLPEEHGKLFQEGEEFEEGDSHNEVLDGLVDLVKPW